MYTGAPNLLRRDCLYCGPEINGLLLSRLAEAGVLYKQQIKALTAIPSINIAYFMRIRLGF